MTPRERATACRYCGHLTWELDKVCHGPSCRRLHGLPTYLPDPTTPAPDRRVLYVAKAG